MYNLLISQQLFLNSQIKERVRWKKHNVSLDVAARYYWSDYHIVDERESNLTCSSVNVASLFSSSHHKHTYKTAYSVLSTFLQPALFFHYINHAFHSAICLCLDNVCYSLREFIISCAHKHGIFLQLSRRDSLIINNKHDGINHACVSFHAHVESFEDLRTKAVTSL